MAEDKNNKFKIGIGWVKKTHSKPKKEIRDQRLTLVLTKSEKDMIELKADAESRSQTKYLIKFLYDHGLFKKEVKNNDQ